MLLIHYAIAQQGNLHNGQIARGFWLEEWEKREIVKFYVDRQSEGYHRIAYILLDQGDVCVSPATVYRVLNEVNLIWRWNGNESKKGTGFDQLLLSHEHWHVDISYLNIAGTFYYFFGVLDGYSRYIVHWEIRESMTERDAAVILTRAREKFPIEAPESLLITAQNLSQKSSRNSSD